MQGSSIMSDNQWPVRTCDALGGRGHKIPDCLFAQLLHAQAATSFPRSWPQHGRAIPVFEAAEVDKFSRSSAEVRAALQLETPSSWGFLGAIGSLRVLSNPQTPSDLVQCPVCSETHHPETCTKPHGVCPALPCHWLLSPSSFWCHFFLLSSNSPLESASPVPPVLRIYPCFQTSKRSRGWAGGARGCPKLMGRRGQSGTAAEVGREGARGGRSSPDAGQHSFLFCLKGFSKPCSIWPFMWAVKSDSRCWYPKRVEF